MDVDDIYGLNLHSAYSYINNDFPTKFKSFLDIRKYFDVDFIPRKEKFKYCEQKKLGD
jgi:hypothetical protein